ncbi:hypothetical protein D3C84_342060 [compost metagenome]
MQEFFGRLPGIRHHPLKQGQVIQRAEREFFWMLETKPFPVLSQGQGYQHGRTQPQLLNDFSAPHQVCQQAEHIITDLDLLRTGRDGIQRPRSLQQQQVNTVRIDPPEQWQCQVLRNAQIHRQTFLHHRPLRIPGLQQQCQNHVDNPFDITG